MTNKPNKISRRDSTGKYVGIREMERRKKREINSTNGNESKLTKPIVGKLERGVKGHRKGEGR